MSGAGVVEVLGSSTFQVVASEEVLGGPPHVLLLLLPHGSMFDDGQELVVRATWNNTIGKGATLETALTVDASPPEATIQYGPVPGSVSRFYQGVDVIAVTTAASDRIRYDMGASCICLTPHYHQLCLFAPMLLALAVTWRGWS